MTTRQTGHTFMIALAAMKTLLTISSLILFAAVALGEELQDTANQLEAKLANLNPANPDLHADVELFHKGVVWALRYDTPLTPSDEALVKQALASGLRRAQDSQRKRQTGPQRRAKSYGALFLRSMAQRNPMA